VPILAEESFTRHFESVLEEIITISDKKYNDEHLLKLPEQNNITVFCDNIKSFILYYKNELNCIISVPDTQKMQHLRASLARDLDHECNKNSVNSVYRKYVENVYKCDWFTEKTYLDFIINYLVFTKCNSIRLYSQAFSSEQSKQTAVNPIEKNDTLLSSNTRTWYKPI
jgi:hypothetical protein